MGTTFSNVDNMDQDYNDPSSIIKMINKFDSDETYFKQLLLE
jgi:hypothetical protein